MQLRGRGKNPVVALRDYSVLRGETIDDRFWIPWDDLFGSRKRRLQQASGQDCAADEAVEAVTGVVGVEGDESLESVGADFLFQEAHFGFGGIFPEFAIQIFS